MDKEQLLKRLEHETKVFQNEKIKEAFTHIDRADFVDEDYKVEAYEDYALPIGFGQHILQPTTMAFMLELLDPQEGERILDVGSGSGFSTALLGYMVGNEGEVFGIELIPELAKKGEQHIQKYNEGQIQILPIKDKSLLFDGEEFDRILVSADTEELPEEILVLLKVGGTIVIPVDGELYKLTKSELGLEEDERIPGFSFDPYINL